MKRLLRLELGRAFSGHGFFLSLALGLVLSLLHFFLTVLPLSLTIDEYLVHNKEPLAFPGWLYSSWLGADPNSVFAFLYFLILPILASLPFADSFFQDAKGGFIQNICIRENRKYYFHAKYLAVFLSGGTCTTLPLLVNFLLCCVVMPAMKPEPAASTSLIFPTSTFPDLYFNHPMLYVFLFLFIIFVFSGLIAGLALPISYHVGYRFLVLIAPFMVYIFIIALFKLLDLPQWQPTNFSMPWYNEYTLWPILIEPLALFLITFFSFVTRGGKEDIY